MKTRIKIIEYNSGQKEYLCQYKEFNIWLFIVGVIFFFYPQILVSVFSWQDFSKGGTIFNIQKATFSLFEDAQYFIDRRIDEEREEKKDEYNSKIKSITKVKYP